MNDFRFTNELLLILSPLVLLQISLVVYCGIKIFKEGVQNLNQWIWLCICIFISVLGPISYLLIGRKKEYT